MTARRSIRIAIAIIAAVCAGLGAAVSLAQQPQQAIVDPSIVDSSIVLDRVVAVVNRRVILLSDVDDEMQLSILEPHRSGEGSMTRPRALEQLISRALIEQQIRQEDTQAVEPQPGEVDARLHEIRTVLPACVRAGCATDEGWKAFLAQHGLTPQRVETYMRRRLAILRFIEQRFRQGIQISPQQIATYYTDILLPQYAPGESTPKLDQVAPRIQEILLEQQVNALFDDWLDNLRKQGDVEILDPVLETAAADAAGGKASP
jgi:hypothetical protein